jgi:hypothetical protein
VRLRNCHAASRKGCLPLSRARRYGRARGYSESATPMRMLPHGASKPQGRLPRRLAGS